MRRIVALFVLALSPAIAFAEPAQAVPTTAQGELQSNGNPADDAQDNSERPASTRVTSTESRKRGPVRSTARPASRAQSFLPGMFR